MTPEEQAVEAKLKELDIPYERHDHEPIMTVAEGQKIAEKLGSHCMKNLFLCAKKKNVLLVAAAGGKEFFLQGTRSAAPVRAPLVRQPREDGGTLKNLSGSGDGAGAHV